MFLLLGVLSIVFYNQKFVYSLSSILLLSVGFVNIISIYKPSEFKKIDNYIGRIYLGNIDHFRIILALYISYKSPLVIFSLNISKYNLTMIAITEYSCFYSFLLPANLSNIFLNCCLSRSIF
jgi:hypothetical protein